MEVMLLLTAWQVLVQEVPWQQSEHLGSRDCSSSSSSSSVQALRAVLTLTVAQE
jgi:hypothetical protein